MAKLFYASLLLTISASALDVPKELSPLKREPFTPRWRTYTADCDNDNAGSTINIEHVTVCDGSPLDHALLLSEQSRRFWTYPSIVEKYRTVDCYYYLEKVCNDPEKLKILLRLQPNLVNGFRDFNPLKQLLDTARISGYTKKHEECINILLENNIDLEKPFPTHNGLVGTDQDKGFENCTPLEYFDKAHEAQKASRINSFVINQTTCDNIKKLFTDKIAQIQAERIASTQQPKPIIRQLSWYQRIPIFKITSGAILFAALGFATRWMPTGKFNFSFLPKK